MKPAPAPDQRALLLMSDFFDLGWYSWESGQTFASKADAVDHYLSVGAAEQLSPSPLFEPSVVADVTGGEAPLVRYLRGHAGAVAPHPGLASTERSRGVGHVEPDTMVDVILPSGTTTVSWRDVCGAWKSVAEQWLAQQRLILPGWVPKLPRFDVTQFPTPTAGPGTLVTVVIPTRDRSKEVIRALKSVQEQTWRHWEAIVVDDGSTDDTAEVVSRLAAHDDRIRFVERPHEGVSATRNTALGLARGAYIAFLDSDNTWLPEYLESMLRVMQARGLEAAYGTLTADTQGGPRYRANQVTTEALLVANHVDLNVLMATSELLARIGGFDVTLRRTVDYDLVLRIARETDLAFIPVVGARYTHERTKSDRISVREAVTWSDHVQLRHRLDWHAIEGRARAEGKVSVVVTVHDRPDAVAAQLGAVAQALDGRDWDAVVVDASEGRRCAAILQPVVATDQRVRYVRLPMEVSFAYAATVGFGHSDGKIALFLEPAADAEPVVLRALVDAVSQSATPVLAVPDAVDSSGQAAEGQTFAIDAATFARAHGLDPLFHNQFDLADLELRLRATEPEAEVRRLDGVTRTVPERPVARLRTGASKQAFVGRHGNIDVLASTTTGARWRTKVVMTMMVRNEADIIAAMVEHHLAQGIDLIIATDNGSVDGTREILLRYADLGCVELHHDPAHQKQQAAVVTTMARRAFTEHGADWVINADADEFYVPKDRRRTLRDVLTDTPRSLQSFTAAVVNLTGVPARRGSGVGRLVWRDHRPEDTLMDVAGLLAHPTPNVIHVGSPDARLRLGNHWVSIESQGQPPPELEIEVLHLPWRSLEHFATKVEMSGRSFAANPKLRPSPNHHGQRDYARFLAGFVEDFYLYRHPVDPASDPGLVEDRWLLEELTRLAGGEAVIPDLLQPILDETKDEPFSSADIESSATVARAIIPLERVHAATLAKVRAEHLADRETVQAKLDAQRTKYATDVAKLKKQVADLRNSRSYRLGQAILRPLNRRRR